MELTLKNDIEPVLPLLGRPSVQLPERVLEDVAAAHVDSGLLPPDALVQPLQLRPEVPPLDVEVENPRVVDENGERPVGQVGRRLAQDLVEHGAVLLGEPEEPEVVLRRGRPAGGLVGLAGAGRGIRGRRARVRVGRRAGQALYRALLGGVHQEERLHSGLEASKRWIINTQV